MLEKLEECPLCGSTKIEYYITCKDYTSTMENFVIEMCKKCELKFTNPRSTEETISKYYQSTEYISHNDTNQGIINKVYQIVKKKAINDKLKLINRYHNKGKIMDIGCGTGSFIERCKENGWLIEGIEPNGEARKRAEEKTGSKISDNILKVKTKESFDVITMWHVLEHVHKIDETINHIKNLLKIKGKLVIAVPNNTAYDEKLYKEYWAAYDVPRHLYHFTKETLIKLIEKFGFKLIAIAPMRYDAYYICLLSNKYKYKHVNYFRAMWEGYKSNKWASKNNNNYSSLTYIFEK